MKKSMTFCIVMMLAIGSAAMAGSIPSYTFESVGSSFESTANEGDGYAEVFFAANSPSGHITHDLNTYKSFTVTLQAPAGQKFVAYSVPGAESRDLTVYMSGGTPGWDYRGQELPAPDYWETWYTSSEIDIDNISFGDWEGSEFPSVNYGSMGYYTDNGVLAGDGGLPGKAAFDGSLSFNIGLSEMSFSSISFDVHAPITADVSITLDGESGNGNWDYQTYVFADAYGDNVGDPGLWLTTVPEPATMCLLGLGGLMIRRRKA